MKKSGGPKRQEGEKSSSQVTEVDVDVVDATLRLVEKRLGSNRVSSSDRKTLRKTLSIFDRLPHSDFDDCIFIEVVGPRRWFGQREIFHWWDIYLDDGSLHVSSGGHIFDPASGCDTFISFTWECTPGLASEFSCYPDQLKLVADALPYDREVAQINLADPSYSISVVEGRSKTAPRPNQHSKAERDASVCDLCGRPILNGTTGRGAPEQAPVS